MTPILVMSIIFFAIFQVLKNFTDYSLKKMIIKSGHVDKAAILDQKVSSASEENREVNRYPSLKWGLVAFFAGMGFILIDQNGPGPSNNGAQHQYMENSLLPLGIEMVCISLGFIIYFLIVNFFKKK
jgi:hypothetical protein